MMNCNKYDAQQSSHRRGGWVTLALTALALAAVYAPVPWGPTSPRPLVNPTVPLVFALIVAPAFFAAAFARKRMIRRLVESGERTNAQVTKAEPMGPRAGFTNSAVVVTVLYKDKTAGTPYTGTFLLEGKLGQAFLQVDHSSVSTEVEVVYAASRPKRFWPLLDERISQHNGAR